MEVRLLEMGVSGWVDWLEKGSVTGVSMVDGAPPPSDVVRAGLELTVRHPEWAEWSLPFLVVIGATAVGTIGGKGPPAEGRVEIGYHVAPAWRGRGVATHALGLLESRARSRGLGLVATVELENRASRRVLEKAGWMHDGELMLFDRVLLKFVMPTSMSDAAESELR